MMEKFVCKHPWSHFEVNNPNGDVTMCCNNNTVLGNVNDAPVLDIWNGEGFLSSRERMRDEGAYAMCPHTCPVLQGGKKYENLDWFKDLSEDGEPRQNAELNEKEFSEGKTILGSQPRWLRFTYSYACNLDCYHCYQREDAKMRIKLPDGFMAELPELALKSQVVFPFGGEPFYFNPVLKFLSEHNTNLETRFFIITNATLLTDKVMKTVGRLPITCVATSLDAATNESFQALRVRGRNASWDLVMENMAKLQKLKREKEFTFTVSLTLNSINASEIETFVDLGLSFDAEPLISLVSNPYQTYEFQKEYLVFSDSQFEDMFAAIERALPKVRNRGFEDSETYLLQLRNILKQHRDTDNNPTRLKAKNLARKAFRILPEQLQLPIRRTVQKARIKRLEKYASEKS
ncbi:MAG: radical SAM protein [Rhodospirillales bacterium]|jgi:MoaA/NifB/PqqE/SkfB family radical SAM enzyme|nr:radical SAM protein [Rhodospirillales bacterium]